MMQSFTKRKSDRICMWSVTSRHSFTFTRCSKMFLPTLIDKDEEKKMAWSR